MKQLPTKLQKLMFLNRIIKLNKIFKLKSKMEKKLSKSELKLERQLRFEQNNTKMEINVLEKSYERTTGGTSSKKHLRSNS